MKIGSYTKRNLYNKQNSNNIYSTSRLWRAKQSNCDIISFGHYLDDELAKKNKQIEDTQKTIQQVSVDTDKLRENATKTNQQLETKITQKKSTNDSLSGQIKRLSDVGAQKDREIKEVKTKSNNYEQEINNSKRESEELRKKQDQLLDKLKREREIAEKESQEKIKLAAIEANEAFKQKVQAVLSSPKNTLIQRVFNPTIIENKGGKALVPGGILIESDSNDISKTLFKWIIQKTNSNYAVLDPASFKNKAKLLKKIRAIAEKSQKEFDKYKKRSFTFIENIESCGIPKAENYPIIGALKDFLDNCSNDFHNTIVVSTKDPTKLDQIVSADHRFQVKVKLDKEFFQNFEMGYNSIIEEINNGKSIGKNLSLSAF